MAKASSLSKHEKVIYVSATKGVVPFNWSAYSSLEYRLNRLLYSTCQYGWCHVYYSAVRCYSDSECDHYIGSFDKADECCSSDGAKSFWLFNECWPWWVRINFRVFHELVCIHKKIKTTKNTIPAKKILVLTGNFNLQLLYSWLSENAVGHVSAFEHHTYKMC